MYRKVFAILSYFCLCSYARGCGTSLVPQSSGPDRVIGGWDTLNKEYPWMISFKLKLGPISVHSCGGVVINENWIVTAAHCIQLGDDPRNYKATAGLRQLTKGNDSNVQNITFSKIVVHEDYDKVADVNDIAMLKTAKPIDISGSNGYVNAICLPEPNEEPTGYATLLGWGYTIEGGKQSDTLREVVLPIVPRDVCSFNYKGAIFDTMICAGARGKDACQLDSGGPIFQTNSYGVSTFIGIVSFGRGCGKKSSPTVFTKVSAYLDWMKMIMATY